MWETCSLWKGEIEVGKLEMKGKLGIANNLTPPPPSDCKFVFPIFQKNIYKAEQKQIIGHQKCETYKVLQVITKSMLLKHNDSKKVNLSCSGWKTSRPTNTFLQTYYSKHTYFFNFVLIWENRRPCSLKLQIFVNWNVYFCFKYPCVKIKHLRG